MERRERRGGHERIHSGIQFHVFYSCGSRRFPKGKHAGKTERLRAILETWIATDGWADVYQLADRPDSTTLATVRAPRTGFIAAASVDGMPQLLVVDRDRVTTDLTAQIDACTNAGGVDIATIPYDVKRANEMIRSWFEAA